jgi:hypothetical protein
MSRDGVDAIEYEEGQVPVAAGGQNGPRPVPSPCQPLFFLRNRGDHSNVADR